MTCISQLIEGGVYYTVPMVKKTAGPLSLVIKYNFMSWTFPPNGKKERENQGTSLLDGIKDRITTQ